MIFGINLTLKLGEIMNFPTFFNKPCYQAVLPQIANLVDPNSPLPNIHAREKEITAVDSNVKNLNQRIQRITKATLFFGTATCLTIVINATPIGFGASAVALGFMGLAALAVGGALVYKRNLINTRDQSDEKLNELERILREDKSNRGNLIVDLNGSNESLNFGRHKEGLDKGLISQEEYENLVVLRLDQFTRLQTQISHDPYRIFAEQFKADTLVITPAIETAIKTNKQILWVSIMQWERINHPSAPQFGPYLRIGLQEGFVTVEEYQRDLAGFIGKDPDFFNVLRKAGSDLDPVRDAATIAILKDLWDAYLKLDGILFSAGDSNLFNNIFSYNELLGFGYTKEQMEEKRQVLAARIYETVEDNTRDVFAVFGEGLYAYIPTENPFYVTYTKDQILKHFSNAFQQVEIIPIDWEKRYLPYINRYLEISNLSDDQKQELRAAIHTHILKQVFNQYEAGNISAQDLSELYGSLEKAVEAYGFLQAPETRETAMASFKRKLLSRYMYDLNPYPYLWSWTHPRYNKELTAEKVHTKIYGKSTVEVPELFSYADDHATFHSPTPEEFEREAVERDRKKQLGKDRNEQLEKLHREILKLKTVELREQDLRFLCEAGYHFQNEERFIKDHDHLKYLVCKPNLLISPKYKEFFFSDLDFTKTARLYTEKFLKYFTPSRKTAKDINFSELWATCPELFKSGIFTIDMSITEDGTTIGQVIEAQFEEIVGEAIAKNDGSYNQYFHQVFIPLDNALARRIALAQLSRELDVITNQKLDTLTYKQFEEKIFDIARVIGGDLCTREIVHYACGERSHEKVRGFFDEVYKHRDDVASYLKDYQLSDVEISIYLVSNWESIKDFVDKLLARNGYNKKAFLYNE